MEVKARSTRKRSFSEVQHVNDRFLVERRKLKDSRRTTVKVLFSRKILNFVTKFRLKHQPKRNAERRLSRIERMTGSSRTVDTQHAERLFHDSYRYLFLTKISTQLPPRVSKLNIQLTRVDGNTILNAIPRSSTLSKKCPLKVKGDGTIVERRMVINDRKPRTRRLPCDRKEQKATAQRKKSTFSKEEMFYIYDRNIIPEECIKCEVTVSRVSQVTLEEEFEITPDRIINFLDKVYKAEKLEAKGPRPKNTGRRQNTERKKRKWWDIVVENCKKDEDEDLVLSPSHKRRRSSHKEPEQDQFDVVGRLKLGRYSLHQPLPKFQSFDMLVRFKKIKDEPQLADESPQIQFIACDGFEPTDHSFFGPRDASFGPIFHNWAQLSRCTDSINVCAKEDAEQAESVCYKDCMMPNELQTESFITCAKCGHEFHSECLSVVPHDLILSVDLYFIMMCAPCNQGQEMLARLPMNWIEIVFIAMHSFNERYNREENSWLDVHEDLLPFLRDYVSEYIASDKAEEIVNTPMFELWIHRVILENTAYFHSMASYPPMQCPPCATLVRPRPGTHPMTHIRPRVMVRVSSSCHPVVSSNNIERVDPYTGYVADSKDALDHQLWAKALLPEPYGRISLFHIKNETLLFTISEMFNSISKHGIWNRRLPRHMSGRRPGRLTSKHLPKLPVSVIKCEQTAEFSMTEVNTREQSITCCGFGFDEGSEETCIISNLLTQLSTTRHSRELYPRHFEFSRDPNALSIRDITARDLIVRGLLTSEEVAVRDTEKAQQAAEEQLNWIEQNPVPDSPIQIKPEPAIVPISEANTCTTIGTETESELNILLPGGLNNTTSDSDSGSIIPETSTSTVPTIMTSSSIPTKQTSSSVQPILTNSRKANQNSRKGSRGQMRGAVNQTKGSKQRALPKYMTAWMEPDESKLRQPKRKSMMPRDTILAYFGLNSEKIAEVKQYGMLPVASYPREMVDVSKPTPPDLTTVGKFSDDGGVTWSLMVTQNNERAVAELESELNTKFTYDW